MPIDTFSATFGRAASERTRCAHGSNGPPSTGGRARWSTTIRSAGHRVGERAHRARLLVGDDDDVPGEPARGQIAEQAASSQSSGSRPTSRRTPTSFGIAVPGRASSEATTPATVGTAAAYAREPRVVVVGLDEHGRVGDRRQIGRLVRPGQLRVQRRRRPEVVMRVDDHLRSTRAASICESSAATGTSTSTSRAASTTSYRSFPHGRYFTGVPPASS